MAGKSGGGRRLVAASRAYPRHDRPPPEARGGRLRLGPQSPRFASPQTGTTQIQSPPENTHLHCASPPFTKRVRVDRKLHGKGGRSAAGVSFPTHSDSVGSDTPPD